MSAHLRRASGYEPPTSVDELPQVVSLDNDQRVIVTYDGRRCGETVVRAGTEAGSYLRRIHSCITQVKAQGPSRNLNEGEEDLRAP